MVRRSSRTLATDDLRRTRVTWPRLVESIMKDLIKRLILFSATCRVALPTEFAKKAWRCLCLCVLSALFPVKNPIEGLSFLPNKPISLRLSAKELTGFHEKSSNSCFGILLEELVIWLSLCGILRHHASKFVFFFMVACEGLSARTL